MLAIASDHGGFDLKARIITHLDENKIPYHDFGAYSLDSVDYPLYAKKVCEAVLSGEYDKGIIICTTGVGVSIMANRFEGIRAALCTDTYQARMTRAHNNANILCLGGAVTGTGLSLDITDIFLNTDFSGEEKHIRRIDMLERG